MATEQNTTRRAACTTRRAFALAPLAAALAMPARGNDALYTRSPALPQPEPWGEARRFISWLHPTGAAAVGAAEGALAVPDDCQGVIVSRDGILRILLPGGIAVSSLGVEAV